MDQIATIKDYNELRTELIEHIIELKRIITSNSDYKGKQWLRSSDVKAMLGISHGKLQHMRNSRQIPFVKINGTIFYNAQDLFAALKGEE